MNMSRILQLLILSLLISCGVSDNTKHVPSLFDKVEYDFGNLKIKERAECQFILKNKEMEPIRIIDVSTSCGCTTIEWTRDTIKVKVKESGIVKVVFDTSIPGVFAKSIYVMISNRSTPEILIVKGYVKFNK